MNLGAGLAFINVEMMSSVSLFLQSLYMLNSCILPIEVVSSMAVMSGCSMYSWFQLFVSKFVFTSMMDLVAFGAQLCVEGYTEAQKTAPMFAYYIKTHVLLNADII